MYKRKMALIPFNRCNQYQPNNYLTTVAKNNLYLLKAT